MLPWLLSGLLLVICAVLVFKIIFMRKSLRDMEKDFSAITEGDTNSMLRVTTSDRYVRELASEINGKLTIRLSL